MSDGDAAADGGAAFESKLDGDGSPGVVRMGDSAELVPAATAARGFLPDTLTVAVRGGACAPPRSPAVRSRACVWLVPGGALRAPGGAQTTARL